MFRQEMTDAEKLMKPDIKVFEQFPEIRAGFTRKSIDAKELKHIMAPELEKRGCQMACLGIIHSDIVVPIEDIRVHENLEPGRWWVHDCDGAVTNRKGIMLTTTTGDCLAVFAYDPIKKVIGLAHAGWRGVLAGMPARLIETMGKTYGCEPQDICAWIGPGISLCCFEVSEDVAQDFWDRYPWCEEYTIDLENGKYKIDLKGISLELMEMTGVGSALASAECTCCQPDDYWSYRRCGDKKRMLQYIEII